MKKTRYPISVSEKKSPVTRFDIIAIAVIMAAYSFIALYNLGDMAAPESSEVITRRSTTIDLGESRTISEINFFLGEKHLHDNCTLEIGLSDNPNIIDNTFVVSSGSVFAWNTQVINESARYITLSAPEDEIPVRELAVRGAENQIIPVVSGSALFDEQSLIPEHISFRNSTYFDEIYHARTGYEFLHKISVYEWTHPPLGKIFIAAGIKLFGMNPFGWRIAGTMFGIFMIPIIYIFSKRIFKHSWLSAVTCLLFTFDFMHFAQTRIATIDVYVTFFIILMYYYMYKYYAMNFYDTPFKKTLIPLALSGLFMGLGIACKWTGIYAASGLAVIFLITIFYRRLREYYAARANPRGETNGIKHQHIINSFIPLTIKTILFCLIFFIAVPLIIYIAAYIPFMRCNNTGFAGIIKNQTDMYTYHGHTVLNSTHSYSSRWYEWPIMARPIWYFSGTVSPKIKEGISSFGNPAVWWVGIAAFIYMVYLAAFKKDKNALFLVIAYMAQLIWWMPITRLTFIYHYFPCVPFIVLMIGYSILCLYKKYPSLKNISFVYTGIVILLFAMFYPVLSGMPVSVQYVKTFLKWFSSWVLI
jgi:hypothetical protein